FFQNTSVNVDIGRREALSPEELASLKEILSSRNIQLKNVILNNHRSENRRYAEEKVFPREIEGGDGNRALMVTKTIRSGQSLYYPGTVVLMGDVHPGGEIAAGENIIIWGSLRGVAHAGRNGNEKAFIIALHLAPSQLRIAHYVACSPGRHSDVPVVPEIAYVVDKRIVVEEYSSSRYMLNGFYTKWRQ
ncbi:MAG: septum site-determining protein MinC, partial [Thermacetogeniaceae bacterium]